MKDPVYIQKLKNIDRSYMKTEKYAESLHGIKDVSAFLKYKRKVHRLSEESYVANFQTINPNSFPRTLAGIEGGYQLDHKISIKIGFLESISPEVIAKVNNLQMLPWKENLMKGWK